MGQSKWRIAFLAATTWFVLLGSGSAHASTPATQCVNQKLEAVRALVSCLLNTEVIANRQGQEVSEERVNRCEQQFNWRFERAEAQAAARGVACPSHGGRDGFREATTRSAKLLTAANSVKTLTVKIDELDIPAQQNLGFNLNIATEVNGTFNVVWWSSSEYLLTNVYHWSDVFSVFASGSIQPGEVVTLASESNHVPVVLGDRVIIESPGVLDQPIQGGPSNAILFTNNFQTPLQPALNQLLTTPEGFQATLPTFIRPLPLLTGTMGTITPVDKVIVWFGVAETGAVFSSVPLNAFPVDLTESDTVTIRFSGGVWSLQ